MVKAGSVTVDVRAVGVPEVVFVISKVRWFNACFAAGWPVGVWFVSPPLESGDE